MKIEIFIDGGSRGNPGPAAIGVSLLKDDSSFKEYAKYIGEATNNIAEYKALIFALKKAKLLFGREKIKKINFEVKSDSELLIKQMRGEYKIKNSEIARFFLEAWNLKIDFKNLKFILIPREKNKIADKLVNQALDDESKQRKLF